MAKCFQVVGQGVPVRMSDEDAFQIVERDRDGQYCPKHKWKAWGVQTNDNGLRKLSPTMRIVSTDTLQFNAQRKRRAR